MQDIYFFIQPIISVQHTAVQWCNWLRGVWLHQVDCPIFRLWQYRTHKSTLYKHTFNSNKMDVHTEKSQSLALFTYPPWTAHGTDL